MKIRIRPPWRWHWGQICRLLAGLELAYWAIQWSPFFGIPVAVWFVIWAKGQDPHPLPHRKREVVATTIIAGQRVERHNNGARITVTPDAVRTHRIHRVNGYDHSV